MEKILQAKLFYFKYLIIVLLAITTIAVSFFFKPQIVQAITLQELAGNISKLSSDEQALLEEVIGAETQIEQKTQEIVSYQQQLDNFEVELKDLYAKTSEIEKNMNAINPE
jgi:septal ring factor EnvC (AmiA/AmiB activator)